MRHNTVSLRLIRTALGAAATLWAAIASAGPINYATHSVGIRAGVVITDSNLVNGQQPNPTPFVWYNLDRNTLVKPAGWNFYNPHAASTESQAMFNRWASLQTIYGGSGPMQVGSTLTKATAGYWEVDLSQTTDTSINDYDVLLLSVYPSAGSNNLLSLTPTERSRLTRFLDHGGVLWIDVMSGIQTDDANGAPLAFHVGPGSGTNPTEVNPTSQIFSYPFALSSIPESTFASTAVPVNLFSDGVGKLLDVLASVPVEFNQYEICGLDGPGGSPTVLTSRVGNGAIVVTSRGVAQFLNVNQALINGVAVNNDGFLSVNLGPDANANQVARFAINAINLVNGSPQDADGSRKTSGTPIDIGAPLLRSWYDETKGAPAPNAAPITYKGLVIVAQSIGGNMSRVYAYSAVPGSDLDFNGNPDDGLPDFGLGQPRDLIWQSVPIPGPVSAPVAVEIANPVAGPEDLIAVVDQNGNLDTFNAFPLLNGSFVTTDNPVYKSYSPPNTSSFAWQGDTPYAPTAHEGLIYITDNVDNGLGSPEGRIWVVDPRAGTYANSNTSSPGSAAWQIGGGSSSPLPVTSAGVTVGYIPIADNSGGSDRVVYVPFKAQTSGASGQACGIASIWAGTKGEHHALTWDNPVTPTALYVVPRATAAGKPLFLPGFSTTTGQFPVNAPDPHGVHLTFLTANGTALTAAQAAQILTGTASFDGQELVFKVALNGPSIANALGVVAVAIDYTLDWNYNGVPSTSIFVRGTLQLPDDNGFEKSIVGDLALSPAGTLYAIEALPSDTAQADGMFYAIREQGQGAFTVVSRFDLYDAFALVTPGVTAVTSTQIPATFEDNDPTQTIPPANPFIAGPFHALEFESGPAVADGRVFVKVRGYKRGSSGFNVPCMLLLCFNAEPQLPNFTVPVLNPSFTIYQPDYNRSTDKTQPETFTSVSSSQVNYIQGTDHASISMSSLSTSTRGAMSQVLSESLPIIIRQPGVPDITIDPSKVGTWSPLQWYTVFYGIDPGTPVNGNGTDYQTGPPVVTGNTVFADGNSYLPYIFSGTFKLGVPPTGMLVGYNAGLSGASDAFTIPNAFRPYFNQITNVTYNPVTLGLTANSDLMWPQIAGITSFAQYTQRLYQTVLDGANLTNPPTIYGLTAGQGGLYAYSNLGVYGFKRANFVVADESRLAAFDPDGNALWTTDSSVSYGVGVVSSAGQENPAITHPLVRPTRAYPIGSSDYLVVDPGSNRLARIDAAGREIRSIDSFVVDPNFQPAGYTAGEPLTFNQPQDVLTYSDYQVGTSPFSNALPTEYWRHYVVADTGNHRLVELVDRYAVDPATNQPTTPLALGVLFYHSPANVSGKRGYDYNSVARVLVPGTGINTPEQYIYAASIGSTEPSRTGLGLDTPVQDQVPTGANYTFQARDARNGNGGIIVFNAANTQVINQVVVPQIGAGVLWDPTANGGAGAFNASPIPAHYKMLGGLSSVTMQYEMADTQGAQPVLTIMFTDSTGVYEISQAANPIVGGNLPPVDWVVDWMLPTEVYTQLRRDPATGLPNQTLFLNAAEFKPTYARRTSAGTILVVNSYFGVDQNPLQSPFTGEIMELDGSYYNPANTYQNWGFGFNLPFLGLSANSVEYQLPTVQGARGIVAPIFADRR